MKLKVGINGFGRFGLHLFKYWLDRYKQSKFFVSFINDENLSLEQVYHIIMNDNYVDFSKYSIHHNTDSLIVEFPGKEVITIKYGQEKGSNIPWIGKVQLFLECSGLFTDNRDAEIFLKDDTKQVIISATSWNADRTLVYGYNHQEHSFEQKLISYGSCTVNAFVPLASFLNSKFSLIDSDVNVIHNVPGYKLKDPKFYSLVRKTCTLEKSGPKLLNFLDANNFKVNYTLIPYDGVSIVDFRLRIKEVVDLQEVIHALEQSCTQGELASLYSLDEVDRGPKSYVCTPYSAVIIKESIDLRQDNLYFMAYFDNENSVNRYYDLVSYIGQKLI